MPLTHKLSQQRNLSKYKTWITDTGTFSDYFRLTQLPDILTAGKNAFLINGTDELINNTEVLVELTDLNGTVVFSTPIPNYQEGLARVVSIEVYEDTPSGTGILTILGEVRQNLNGELAPKEWQGIYNVKWQKKVTISPRSLNDTPVRLYEHPTVSVSEVLSSYSQSDPIAKTVTTPVGVKIGGVPSNRVFVNNPFKTVYTVISESPIFTKEMVGGEITYNISGSLYSGSIGTVINSTMAQISPGYSVNGILTEFTATEVMVDYSGSTTPVLTTTTKSYADIRLNKLNTFSGNIYRAKVFTASATSEADYHLAGDVVISPANLLQTGSQNDGEGRVDTGYFKDQIIVNEYWTVGKIDTDLVAYNGG